MKGRYSEREYNDALSTDFYLHKQLNLFTLTNKPVSQLIILKEFIKTNRLLGKKTAKDIASLPELTVEQVAMGQRMLELAGTSSHTVSIGLGGKTSTVEL